MVFLDYTTQSFSVGASLSSISVYSVTYKCLILAEITVASSNRQVYITKGVESRFIDGNTSGAIIATNGETVLVDNATGVTFTGTLHIFRLPEAE